MLSKRLKELRRLKECTQSDVAKFLGVSKSTIASYEQGVNEPNVEKLKGLSEYFGTTLDYLTCNSNHRSQDAFIIQTTKQQAKDYMSSIFENVLK